MWPNGKPGLGIDIDEKLAAKYPIPERDYVQGAPFEGPTARLSDHKSLRGNDTGPNAERGRTRKFT